MVSGHLHSSVTFAPLPHGGGPLYALHRRLGGALEPVWVWWQRHSTGHCRESIPARPARDQYLY